jgi:hypothetical protein
MRHLKDKFTKFTANERAFYVGDVLIADDTASTDLYFTDSCYHTDLADAPSTYLQMLKRPDKDEWLSALASENLSLLQHDVFEVAMDIPRGANIIKAKFLFKRKSDGRYKVRLVAKGFSQIEGIDYGDVFAPVVGKNTLWLWLLWRTGTLNSVMLTPHFSTAISKKRCSWRPLRAVLILLALFYDSRNLCTV